MNNVLTATRTVPREIVERVVLPEGHRDDPALFRAYDWLRDNAPLARVELEGYDPIWLVSKHSDIMEIERQAEKFSNGGGADAPGTHNSILNTQAGDAFTRELTGGTLRSMQSLAFMDAPEHTIVRDMGAALFRPDALGAWEERIRVLAREAIEHRLRRGVNDLDIVQDFALYYPLHVIMTLLGVPSEEEPRMMQLTQEMFGSPDPEEKRDDVEAMSPATAAEQWNATIRDFYGYFDKLLQARRDKPADDLASVIANARTPDGELFPADICYGWFITISTAGHDTTSNTLATAIEALGENPEQLAALKADPKMIPSFINEALRWTSPVKHFVRLAMEDYELRGQQINAGDRLMLLYQSANRDEDVFVNPYEFHFDRKPNRHIAFGYGPHMCLGQFLAKLELRVMLEELLPRISSIELTGERKMTQTNFVGGVKNRPMRLTVD